MIQKQQKIELRIGKGTSDLIKFVSAIMVALHHYSQYVISNNLSDNLLYKLFSTQGGYLGVAIFFFLSGYGLMESEQKKHLSYSYFLRKRLSKVYLPVFLVTAMWLPLYYSFNTKDLLIFGGGNSLIYNLLWGFGDGVLWFVKVLLFLYIVFCVFTTAWNRKQKVLALVLLNLLTAVIMVGTRFAIGSYAMLSVPIFAIGVMASVCKQQNRGCVNKSLIYLLFWFVFSVLYIAYSETTALAAHALINYVCIAFGIIFFTIYDIQVTIPKVMSNLSYDIYLVHNKVLTVMKMTLDVVPLIGFLMVATVCTLLFYKINNKLKI